ncbi:chorismate-binding protein [Pseudomonadales bacterium]|nr:chorismate-binding protein [Pseudomonadales bacterium]
MIKRCLLYNPVSSQWRSFSNPVDILLATTLDEVEPVLRAVEQRVNAENLIAAGFVSYEAASGFDPSLTTHKPGKLPLVYFGLFADVDTYSPEAPLNPSSETWCLDTEHADFQQDIESIRAQIAVGDVYQINHTLRLRGGVGNPWTHFQSIGLEAPQGAYIETDKFVIASGSPELFFHLDNQRLISRPMKGTAQRGSNEEADKEQQAWLADSKKNQAENLMITDMVRNDLGRVAKPGSVKVSELFALERYPTVWQMTSSIEAETDASVTEIFKQLFPAASITGAPKRAAMCSIAQLEKTPREIYTGAIGYIAPKRQAQFSIAIRTTWIDQQSGQATYGAGGGIVWDSVAEEEYAEVLAKTRILNNVKTAEEFALFETLGWDPEAGFSLLEQHLSRMQNSANFFGIAFVEAEAKFNLEAAVTKTEVRGPQRVRLTLSGAGAFTVACHGFAGRALDEEMPSIEAKGQSQERLPEQLIALCKTPIQADDPLLRHKTTDRSAYERARSEVPEGVEPMMFNQAGEITESDIANIVYCFEDQLFTPPVSSGLLPGTLRAQLLNQGTLAERVLKIDELDNLQAIFLLNDLRGWRKAKIAALAD